MKTTKEISMKNLYKRPLASLLLLVIIATGAILSACDQPTDGTETPGDYTPVSAGNTFLVYGYNVITSAYINRNDVKMSRPILDLDKVNAAQMIVQSNATSSSWQSAAGESIMELFESLHASAKVGYEGVAFSGSVEAEFTLTEDSKNEARYAKGQGFHITRDEYLKTNAPSALSALLTDTFKNDIASRTAVQLISDYGTHLMTRVYWGGEAEFNYKYTGTELATTGEIKAALNASYGGFSGSASAELEQKAKELNNHSTFTSSSRGGDNSAFTSQEAFNTGYADWVQSVQNKPDICGIPKFENDLLPLWELVAAVDPAKAQQIEAEFEKIVTARGTALAGYVYVPQGSRTYITAIDIQQRAASNTTVPGGMTSLVKADMYNPASPTVLNIVPALRDNFQIAYKTAIKANNNHRQAIAEIALTWGVAEPVIPAGWQKVNYNMGPTLLTDTLKMYLIYRPVNQSDTRAIDFIGSYRADTEGTGYIDGGYEWVGLHPAFSADNPRWNITTFSSTYTYLTVHYNPFEW
jgi:hypothetical protein